MLKKEQIEMEEGDFNERKTDFAQIAGQREKEELEKRQKTRETTENNTGLKIRSRTRQEDKNISQSKSYWTKELCQNVLLPLLKREEGERYTVTSSKFYPSVPTWKTTHLTSTFSYTFVPCVREELSKELRAAVF